MHGSAPWSHNPAYLLKGMIQIKIGHNFLISNSNIVQVFFYPVIPAFVEVLVEVVDPVSHNSLPGELASKILKKQKLKVWTESEFGSLD